MTRKPKELEPFTHEAATCSFCPKMCRFSCPVDRVEGSESTSPWGKVTLLRHVQQGQIPLDHEVLDSSYRCTGCLACKKACVHEQELPPMFEAVRAMGAAAGLAPEALKRKDELMSRFGNPVGPELGHCLVDRVPASRFGRQAPVLIFFGCTTLKKYPGIVDDTVRVLDAGEVDYAVAGPDQICSGLPSASHGYPQRFREVALRNIERFRRYPRVISDCPGAVSTFRRRYPELGLPASVQVEHLSILLLELLTSGRLQPRTQAVEKAFYHDPCHLGRYLGVYDQPRELLRRLLGEQPEELTFNRDLGLCSGGGGGLPLTAPTTAKGVARLPVEETRSRKGSLLVSPCPTARKMFSRADSELDVQDPVTLLARRL